MSVFNILKDDHRKVAKLLDEASETTERAIKGRKELISKIKSELTLHSKMEESIFYPVLKEYKETHELIMESYAEHETIEYLLKQVSSEGPENDEWLAKLTVLKENVEHHVDEEENQLFPKVRKILDQTQLNEMAEKMKRFKEEHK